MLVMRDLRRGGTRCLGAREHTAVGAHPTRSDQRSNYRAGVGTRQLQGMKITKIKCLT